MVKTNEVRYERHGSHVLVITYYLNVITFYATMHGCSRPFIRCKNIHNKLMNEKESEKNFITPCKNNILICRSPFKIEDNRINP